MNGFELRLGTDSLRSLHPPIDAIQLGQQDAINAGVSLAQNAVIRSILNVGKRENNWDSNGSPKPRFVSEAIEAAVRFMQQAFTATRVWEEPFVGSNEYGEISFEWWNGARKLTIYCGNELHFVSSWGAHIDDHMDAGLLSPEAFAAKWRWLRQPHN